MYLLIIFFPFCGCLISSLLGRFLGNFYISLINTLSIFISLLLNIFIFYEVVLLKIPCTVKVFEWLNLGNLKVNFEFLFDSLSVTMLLVILTISFLVHLYSLSYMKGDPHIIRFLFFLTLFTLFMMIYVISNNFVQLFLGWEGVGLSSYLLINFWHTRAEANRSALKAVFLNRFGDFGLYSAILVIYYSFKSLDFSIVFSLTNLFYNHCFSLKLFDYTISNLTLISFFLLIGAAGKSAQLGLHVWLPDAMEGPTPVSALIHAATMVTAGVYLLIRSSPLIEFSDNILLYITILGALTAFFSSTVGIVQNDIKRVIAYSTCSQLGYMIFSCGISNYYGSFFHLFNHAFFKALLFLGAGSVIHALNNEQDMRKYGGLVNILPFTYISLFIGSLSLIGFPFLSGFYSKDFIIETAFCKFTVSSLFAYWLGSVSVLFTSFYSFRLIVMSFFFKPNGPKKNYHLIHEADKLIQLPLVLLSILSLVSGYLFFDLIAGFGSDIFSDSIFTNPKNNYFFEAEFLPFYIKNCPLFFSFLGFIFALLLNYLYEFTKNMYLNRIYFEIHSFLVKKWYFDLVYFNFIIRPFLYISYNLLFKTIDRGLLEIVGPTGLVRLVNSLSYRINNIQMGYIYFYSFLIFILFFIFSFLLFLNFFTEEYFVFFILLFFFSIFIDLNVFNTALNKDKKI